MVSAPRVKGARYFCSRDPTFRGDRQETERNARRSLGVLYRSVYLIESDRPIRFFFYGNVEGERSRETERERESFAFTLTQVLLPLVPRLFLRFFSVSFIFHA